MGSSSKWLACYQPRHDAAFKLICLPFAGASAYAYRDWIHWLPDAVELHAAQLPGRGTRITEPAVHQMEALIEALCASIEDLGPGPLAIYGHSTGGIVGYELCLALQRRGCVVEHLFASACEAPGSAHRYRPLHLLSDDELLEELRSLDGTSDDLLDHPGMRETLLPPLRADFALAHEHQPSQDALKHPITVYGATSDPWVSVERLGEWGRFTTAGHQRTILGGDHWFIMGQGDFKDRFSKDLAVLGARLGGVRGP